MADFGTTEQELLRALREYEGPSERDRARVSRRLEAELSIALGAGALVGAASVGAGSVGAAGAGAGAGVGASVGAGSLAGGAALGGVGAASVAGGVGGAALGGLGLAKWGVGVLLVGALSWGVYRASPLGGPVGREPSLVSAPPSTPARQGAPAGSPAPSARGVEPLGPQGGPAQVDAAGSPEPAAGEASLASSEEAPVAPARAPRSSASAPSGVGAGRASGLDSELALIGEAQRVLAAGDARRALTLLEQHASAYPRGALGVERAGLRAVALCQSGRLAEGRAQASRFVTAHARSLLVTRVRNACGLSGE